MTNLKKTLQLVQKDYDLKLPPKLLLILQAEIDKAGIPEASAAYIHFRDKSGYTAEHGGFRPVEIYINEAGIIQYITEFCYVGTPPMEELAKSADFDLSQSVYQDLSGCYPLKSSDVRSFWKLWVGNFIEYHKMDIYTLETKEGP
jgi:hypothetical protein